MILMLTDFKSRFSKGALFMTKVIILNLLKNRSHQKPLNFLMIITGIETEGIDVLVYRLLFQQNRVRRI